MTNDALRSHDMYFNRELSWLEFNDRVLRQGLADDVPLLERVKFLAIVSSNLDEFFLVRVAGLMSARARRRAPPRPFRHDPGRAVAGRQPARAPHGARAAGRGPGGPGAACRGGHHRGAGRGMDRPSSGNSSRPISARKSSPCSRRWRSRSCTRRRGCPGCNGTWPWCWRKAEGAESGSPSRPFPSRFSRWVRLPGDGVRLARLEDVDRGQRRLALPRRRDRWPRPCSASPATPTFPSSATRPTTCSRRSSGPCSRGSGGRRSACRSRPPPIPAFAPGSTSWLKLQPEEVYEMDSTLDGGGPDGTGELAGLRAVEERRVAAAAAARPVGQRRPVRDPRRSRRALVPSLRDLRAGGAA